jgi:spore coat polysaccharide biosynthesis protein SpsF (cytidylyltransferase family)
MNEISTKVSVFLTSTVPTLRNLSLKYDEEKIVDYYNNNFGTVKELCGEITKTQFVELTNLVRKMNTKELKYVSSEYMTDTIQKSDNLFKINLKISYENEDPIIVTINVSDLQKTIKLTCAE